MKKIAIAIFAVSGLFVSCQTSIEDKAADLIKESVCKSLYQPESYESVEIQLDRAFAPYELPVGIIMAFLGAPFFIFILIKGKGGHSRD